MTQPQSQQDRIDLLEHQVAMLKQQLVQAQRMTAVGELASTVTHEFNNVLMTIINYAKLGLRYSDDATREKSLQKIFDASHRATRITQSILGMARNRSAGQEPTDVAKLIEDALLLLEREMNKYRVSVEKQFQPAPLAQVNGNQIQQVLLNLLVNARQAMPNGGRLIVGVSHDAEAETVDLLVRDFGTGIAPEKLRRIFDRFFTTKDGPDDSGKGGSGLGLAACRDIIEAHQGRIRVESTLGKGTAFTIKLPVAKRAAAVAALPADTTSSAEAATTPAE